MICTRRFTSGYYLSAASPPDSRFLGHAPLHEIHRSCLSPLAGGIFVATRGAFFAERVVGTKYSIRACVACGISSVTLFLFKSSYRPYYVRASALGTSLVSGSAVLRFQRSRCETHVSNVYCQCRRNIFRSECPMFSDGRGGERPDWNAGIPAGNAAHGGR